MVNSLISDDGSNIIANSTFVFSNNQTERFIRGIAFGGAIRLRSNNATGDDRGIQIGTSDNNGVFTSAMSMDSNSNNFIIHSTTQSTSPTTGALVTPGGIGVGGNSYFGGEIVGGLSLNVGGQLVSKNNSDQFKLQSYTSINKFWTIGTSVGSSGANRNFTIYESDLGNAVTIIQANGNTNIGYTTDQGYKLAVNGTAGNTTGSWSVISDETLKTNIEDIHNPIDKALSIAKATKQFNYIDETKYASGRRTQYIAQLLQENGFEGHVSEHTPRDEEEGALFGWEYGDKEVVTKTYYNDVDGNPILLEDGTEVFTEEVTTERIVTKEGRKVLNVENNLAPYIFPAFAALYEKHIALEARMKLIEDKLNITTDGNTIV